MARGRHTRDDFLAAALQIAAESGLGALTSRSLGEHMGLHSTAVYRHYPVWDDLMVAVVDAQLSVLLGDLRVAIASAGSPRERVLAIMRALRAAVDAEPLLADGLFALARSSATVPTPTADAITREVIASLQLMGLDGEHLVLAHQALESCAVGTAVIDFAGYPDHAFNRMRRRRMLGVADFESSVTSPEQIAKVNNDAFEFAAQSLIDGCERLAKQG